VEFGPWVRSFTAQVRRNWVVPQGMSWMATRVIVRFIVRKDGTITAVSVVGPSAVEALNNAASDALVVSSPTTPLPDAYPDDQASFTVTFHYNGQGF
jgi:TonB family protein